jgi:hypothetical protein
MGERPSFPSKKSLFPACQDLVRARIRASFESVGELVGPPDKRLAVPPSG